MDVRMEHDPESGCYGCPVARIVWDPAGDMDRECGVTGEWVSHCTDVAPPGCPLRTGSVMIAVTPRPSDTP